jgi:hypothetical protein
MNKTLSENDKKIAGEEMKNLIFIESTKIGK